MCALRRELRRLVPGRPVLTQASRQHPVVLNVEGKWHAQAEGALIVQNRLCDSGQEYAGVQSDTDHLINDLIPWLAFLSRQ